MPKSTLPIFVVLMASVPTSVFAADFGSLPICATVTALPKGARVAQWCEGRRPINQCAFTLARDQHAIRYVTQRGKVVDKSFRFSGREPTPFGITRDDTQTMIAAKFRQRTGKAVETGQLPDSADTMFLQSADLPCKSGTYRLTAYFTEGKISVLGVSTLPMF